MDLDLQTWLLILGPLLIVGILVHGYFRMRSRNTLKMALDKRFLNTGDTEEDGSGQSLVRAELPNGGARVVDPPEQGSLDLADVPVLMEPVDVDEALVVTSSDSDAETGAELPTVIDQGDRPERFIVLYVSADEQKMTGQALLESLVEHEMRFGEMDIFHRLDVSGQSLFSLVNAVEPGSFDLQAMDDLETPAVSLFMRVHEVSDPVAVFDDMMHVAQNLANDLGADVLDETRSAVTPQTTAHLKQELEDYQFRHG
ncbi:MAG: cell division protein ZipA [Gammaproteobacteria bacterium]|uniref:Cell division protein ZipA n=1 Tax=OM182 bacterium MED-G24 TaxID=1986255 RepID=A0A2A5WHN8_9GAMM|nr:cell division protein ZipA [Gammaproteobacteria bacterium]PDH35788.1 MAG: cell division protein ZipA [OM182 bacterium MED-G24]RPG26069.1 MAG: cell division protein ZipA [Gammaproteobacteria bacterium TMED50]